MYEGARKWMREVSVCRYAQDLTVAVVFQVMHVEPNVLTAKITNNKSREFVKLGNIFSSSTCISWGTTAFYIIFLFTNKKKYFAKPQRSKQDRACTSRTPNDLVFSSYFSRHRNSISDSATCVKRIITN